MKTLIGTLAFLILITSSCKKDELVECPTPVPDIPLNYTPMSIGDYWIYEVFHVDTNGNDSSLNRTDSMYVSGDTVIDGNTYTVIAGDHFIFGTTRPLILRDSSGFMVSNGGGIYFSTTDSITKFNENVTQSSAGDTLMYWYNQMILNEIQVATPAGYFSCTNNQMFFFHTLPQLENPRLYPNYFANNVGQVIETIGYASQPGFYERRLIRYQVTIAIP